LPAIGVIPVGGGDDPHKLVGTPPGVKRKGKDYGVVLSIDRRYKLDILFRFFTELKNRCSMSHRLPSSADASHMMIEARAGTGKSFTMYEAARRLMGRKGKGVVGSPEQEEIWRQVRQREIPRSITAVTFLKSMEEEMKAKMPFGVEVRSTYSVGYQGCLRHFGRKLTTNGDKGRDTVMKLMEVTTDLFIRNKVIRNQVMAVKKCVDLMKLTLAETTEAGVRRVWSSFEVSDEVAPNPMLVQVVLAAIEAARDLKDNTIDFTDQVWLAASTPGLTLPKADILIVDEAQDLNAAQQFLALKAGDRLLIVGDPYQAIFAFTGADPLAFERFYNVLSESDRCCQNMPLLASRRCPAAVTQLAKTIVPDFTCMPDTGEGKVTYEPASKALDRVVPGDMIVCRNNAPLVRAAYRLIADGKRAKVVGRDFSQTLVKLIDTIGGSTIGQFTSLLRDYHSTRKQNLIATMASDETVMALDDKCGCLKFLAEKANSVDKMKQDIAELFAEDADSIRLSSVHRAKGLEADRVYVLRPDILPHPMAMKKGGWAASQERNLYYVAVTRSRNELTFCERDGEKSGDPADEL
jgi:DNA helicase-2/ATP-dependent DNA helicase PcrA